MKSAADGSTQHECRENTLFMKNGSSVCAGLYHPGGFHQLLLGYNNQDVCPQQYALSYLRIATLVVTVELMPILGCHHANADTGLRVRAHPTQMPNSGFSARKGSRESCSIGIPRRGARTAKR